MYCLELRTNTVKVATVERGYNWSDVSLNAAMYSWKISHNIKLSLANTLYETHSSAISHAEVLFLGQSYLTICSDPPIPVSFHSS